MKNYVITLSTSIERQNHIRQEFTKQNINFQFFEAITPARIDTICSELGLSLNKNQRMSAGEQACFLSHICLWQEMIGNNDDYIAIFEDDIYLGKGVDKFLTNDKWIDDYFIDFNIIKLETFLEKVGYSIKYTALNNRKFFRLKSSHSGTAGYIISIDYAKRMINKFKEYGSNEFNPIDHVMFSDYLMEEKVLQIIPGICIQGDRLDPNISIFASNLKSKRAENKINVPKVNKNFSHYLKKLKRSIGKRTYYKIIPFQ